MKSISIQYQELKEGKMTQHQFLRNARMMFPNFITNLNSFDDSVKILKNRGLLNEGNAVKGVPDKAPSYDYPTQPGKYKKVVQEPEVDEQDGIYPATTLTDIPKEEVSKHVGDNSDGLEPIKPHDKKNEMKKVRIVKESKKNLTEAILKIYQYDPSSGDLDDVDVEHFGSEEEAKKAALAHHWQVAYDNQDTELSKDEFIAQTKWEDLEPYETYGYEIVSDKGNIKEANINVKQIQDKYNEMFGKNPQTTFADVAKALGVSEQEIAIALFSPDLAKNMGRIAEAEDDISPDAKAFIDMIEKNPTLKSRLEKISNPKEIEDIVSKLFAKIDPSVLKNMPGVKSAVVKGISKIAGISGKEEFRPKVDLGKSSEKFLSQFRSPGASGPGGSLNKLKEAVKALVNKMLDEIGPGGIQAAGDPEEEKGMRDSIIKKEYEVGDESDDAPSAAHIIDRIVEAMIDRIESNDLGLEWNEKDVIDVVNNFEDRMGHRYSDEEFNQIIDGATNKLQQHGYNIKK